MKNIKGKQRTIIWHFDKLNMLHVDSKMVSSFLYNIDTEYAKITEQPSHGVISTSNSGWPYNTPHQWKVKLYMVNYIGKMLGEILEYMKGESSTLASHNLFDISEDATKLS